MLHVIHAAMAIVFRTRSEEIALGMTLLGLFFSSVYVFIRVDLNSEIQQSHRLYGLALSQLYTYYKRFPRDPLSVKVLVCAIPSPVCPFYAYTPSKRLWQLRKCPSGVLVCYLFWTVFQITQASWILFQFYLNVMHAGRTLLWSTLRAFSSSGVQVLSGDNRFINSLFFSSIASHTSSGPMTLAVW